MTSLDSQELPESALALLQTRIDTLKDLAAKTAELHELQARVVNLTSAVDVLSKKALQQGWTQAELKAAGLTAKKPRRSPKKKTTSDAGASEVVDVSRESDFHEPVTNAYS